MNLETLFQIMLFISTRGLANTLVITLGSFFLGLGIGVLISFIQITIGGVVGRVVDVVTRFLRSIPPILMLFIIFYGLKMNNVLASIIGLGLVSAAYQSQILKGVAEAIAAKQLEAAISIGLSKWGAFLYVVVPQVVLLATPALLNEFATLLKDTSIAYAIGVTETFTIAVNIANARMEYVTPLVAVSTIYLSLCLFISLLANMLTRKLKAMGYGVTP